MNRRAFTASLAHLVFVPKFEKWYRQTPQGIWYTDYKAGCLVNVGLRNGSWVIVPLAGREHATEFTVIDVKPKTVILGFKDRQFEFELPKTMKRIL